MHKSKEETTSKALKTTYFPANILIMEFSNENDESYKNKLSKLEPNPNPLCDSIPNTIRTKKTKEKNLYESVNLNDMTFYNNENKNNNQNLSNRINNMKESTLKKSEVTFSDKIIDINTHIKRNSVESGYFFDMSPVRLEAEKLKSVKQHIKTPYSKLRHEDLDSEDDEGQKNKVLNDENEYEIKICEEILPVKREIFVSDIGAENEISKEECLIKGVDGERENKNNNNNDNNTESEISVGDGIEIGKVGKLNLKKKIEMLNLNTGKLNNLSGFTNHFQEIMKAEEKEKNKAISVLNNNVIFTEEDREKAENSSGKNTLRNPFSEATEIKNKDGFYCGKGDNNENPFSIAHRTQAKLRAQNPKDSEFPSGEFLYETYSKKDLAKNMDWDNPPKETKSKKLENTLDRINMLRKKYTPKSILKNSNSTATNPLNNSSIIFTTNGKEAKESDLFKQ